MPLAMASTLLRSVMMVLYPPTKALARSLRLSSGLPRGRQHTREIAGNIKSRENTQGYTHSCA